MSENSAADPARLPPSSPSPSPTGAPEPSPAWPRMRGPVRAGLVYLLLAAVAGWAFIRLAGAVAEGDLDAFDRAILLSMRDEAGRPRGPSWFATMVRDVSALGGSALLILITLACAGGLALLRRARAGLALLVSVGGGLGLSVLLKALFDRPRPDLAPHGVQASLSSFPSGHAMMSMIAFLTLGAMLAGQARRRGLKVYVLGLAVGVSLLVGLSRVYLGVHWPSDVLAGWAAGAAWAIACRLAAARLLDRPPRAGGPARPGRGPALRAGLPCPARRRGGR